jgi:hypothetical protein
VTASDVESETANRLKRIIHEGAEIVGSTGGAVAERSSALGRATCGGGIGPIGLRSPVDCAIAHWLNQGAGLVRSFDRNATLGTGDARGPSVPSAIDARVGP